MDLKFAFHGIPLKESEAAVLFQTMGGKSKEQFFDLSNVFNLSSADAPTLFQCAVETKSEALATLAYKVGSITVTQKRTEPQEKPKVTTTAPQVTLSVEDIIDKINTTNARWAVGVAMLIVRGSQEKDWATVKQTACHFVNTLKAPIDSNLFKGFTFDNKKNVYVPRVWNAGVNRKDTFHVSPVYMALMCGFRWCEQNDLIQKQRRLSEPGEHADPRYASMQRVYYRYKLTEKGDALADTWADAMTYVKNYYKVSI
jgi:hypothetical protein